LLIGYCIGFGFLSFNVFILTPQLKLILAAKREGPKKLILKSPANPAKAKFGQLKDKYSSPKTEPACKDKPLSKLSDDSILDIKNIGKSNENSPVQKKAFNNSQKSSLIKDFKNNRNLAKLSKMYRNNK